MQDQAISNEPIITGKDLRLEVPVFMPNDRRLLTNPINFLVDLYLLRSMRGNATLLEDITFILHRGKRLGIIGANGAGKSTLLRVLAGIYKPTSGELIVKGNVKGLFDISLGMNHEATGLENIYLRGLQMGLVLDQIKELVPDVIAFAELGEAIEKPFGTYSTGMRLRLAFSVSTMIEPDVLLLDEWIGAGDINFREKVAKRMDNLVENSSALVLATHNTSLMKRLCTHGLVLDKGKMLFHGEVEEALEFYSTKVIA